LLPLPGLIFRQPGLLAWEPIATTLHHHSQTSCNVPSWTCPLESSQVFWQSPNAGVHAALRRERCSVSLVSMGGTAAAGERERTINFRTSLLVLLPSQTRRIMTAPCSNLSYHALLPALKSDFDPSQSQTAVSVMAPGRPGAEITLAVRIVVACLQENSNPSLSQVTSISFLLYCE
jgi:hypothetical protein